MEIVAYRQLLMMFIIESKLVVETTASTGPQYKTIKAQAQVQSAIKDGAQNFKRRPRYWACMWPNWPTLGQIGGTGLV